MHITEAVLGKPVVDALIETLYNQCQDFPKVHQDYLTAIGKLRETLGPEAERDIQRYITAIEQMCASNLFYSGVLGFKMNYDHFINPMAPNCTWKQVDFDDYLNPHVAEHMPLYVAAYRYMEQFERKWPAGLDEIHQAIQSYVIDLEICGTKLAHYYGYLAGNELLKHCVPGYHSDMVLEINYRHLLQDYFGRPLNLQQWEGGINLKEWLIAPLPEVDPQDTFLLREEIMKNATV